MKKVTAKEYNKLLSAKMKEVSNLTMDEKFLEMLEWCMKFKIVSGKVKKNMKNKNIKGGGAL
jgi:hypothetical protein